MLPKRTLSSRHAKAAPKLSQKSRKAAAAIGEIVRKRAEVEAAIADAQKSNARLREAIDLLPQGIVFLDAEGRYILWNKKYSEIYNRSSDLFEPGARLQDTIRVGVERGDYPEAIGREEEWIAERIAKLTCAKALNYDPWNGLSLYLFGLGQIHLGRFEDALATFRQADRFDTPQVSRWTWLLGAGWANVLMGRADDALPWLQRSIAITPASGRSHMLMTAAYQQLGLTDQARAAMTEGLKLRPGTTALNISPPTKNASPVFVEAGERVIQLMVTAGLPES